MTDEEIEVVAEELAKSSGLSWYPGRAQGPLMRLVTDHHREQARVVIAALERLRAGEDSCWAPDLQRDGPQETIHRGPVSEVRPGATIIYRPPGDQRAYPCRIVEIRGDRAYLAPIVRTCVGWISIESLQVSVDEEVPNN
jgi:hypothetical protein